MIGLLGLFGRWLFVGFLFAFLGFIGGLDVTSYPPGLLLVAWQSFTCLRCNGCFRRGQMERITAMVQSCGRFAVGSIVQLLARGRFCWWLASLRPSPRVTSPLGARFCRVWGGAWQLWHWILGPKNQRSSGKMPQTDHRAEKMEGWPYLPWLHS